MSAELWVLVEHDGAAPRPVALELLGRARELGAGATAVVLAADPTPVAEALGGAADRVLAVADARLARPVAEDLVTALAGLLEPGGAGLLVAGATAMGRDVMPRLAARLGAPLAAGCTWLGRADDGRWRARRPVQGGRAYAELVAPADQGLLLATVRPNSFTAAAAEGGPAAVEVVTVDLGAPARVERLSSETSAGRVPLEEAAVVVAGGRGMGERFDALEALAAAVGGAVGASRAVVDARIRPVEEQVGKSGKTVSPRLYIAAGISGAVHHTMGMDTSGVVVAINRDPDAPIFASADLGLVGDAPEVVAALADRLRG